MSVRSKKPSGGELLDTCVDIALKEAEKAFGADRCYVAAEHAVRQVVLPVSPLSLRWLIESNGWPLGRFTQSGGPYGSAKSSFCFELISWTLQAGGFATHIDTEKKTSATLVRSIIPPEYFDTENPKHKRFQFLQATSINEWQQMASKTIESIQSVFNNANAKPCFPIVITVDSLRGSQSEEMITHLKEEGEAKGRGFGDAPILISNYLSTAPNQLMGWPITLHTTNHEKPGVTTPGMIRAGGKAPDFYATLDIQFKKGGESALSKSVEIDRVAFKGKNIKLHVRKSSMGSDVNKEIVVPFCWRFEPDLKTGGSRQVSWWDWSSATAMVLKKEERYLKDIIDIGAERKHGGAGMHFWSDRLGIKKDSSLPAAEFGRVIEEENPELRLQIENALHITQHPSIQAEAVES
jgi:RecA/RadA recombinase